MKELYKCDVCGDLFTDCSKCLQHEKAHFTTSNIENLDKQKLINSMKICDYCEHSYYVYGCERDCNYAGCNGLNKYKDYKPVIPFRDKSHNITSA